MLYIMLYDMFSYVYLHDDYFLSLLLMFLFSFFSKNSKLKTSQNSPYDGNDNNAKEPPTTGLLMNVLELAKLKELILVYLEKRNVYRYS